MGPKTPQNNLNFSAWSLQRCHCNMWGFGGGRASFATTSARSLPTTSSSARPRVRRWASNVCALIHSTEVPPPTRRIRFSRSMCFPLVGRTCALSAATTRTTPLQSDTPGPDPRSRSRASVTARNSALYYWSQNNYTHKKNIGELIFKLHTHKLHKNNSEGINCVIFV